MDNLHAMDDGDDVTANADGDQEVPSSSSDQDIVADAAVAGDGENASGVEGAENAELESKGGGHVFL